jgi:hypothetical protein
MHKLSGYMNGGCEIDFTGQDDAAATRRTVPDLVNVARERARLTSSGDTTLRVNCRPRLPVGHPGLEDFHSPSTLVSSGCHFLHGRVALSNGRRDYLDAPHQLPSSRWRAVHFTIEPNGLQVETKEIYHSAHYPLPLLVIKEGASAMPPLLECAAHLQLDCGP